MEESEYVIDLSTLTMFAKRVLSWSELYDLALERVAKAIESGEIEIVNVELND